MMTWIIKDGFSTDLGLLPHFLREDDPRPARDQINERYVSGWNPMKGFTVDLSNDDVRLTYPGDPPFRPYAFTILRDEMIFLFESDWLLIVQPDKSFEVARVD